MNPNREARYILGLVLLLSSLGQSAAACNEITAPTKAPEREPDSDIFVLDLQLCKSGEVRSVEVLIGAGSRRTKAIRAATSRTYERPTSKKSDVTTVEVKFPHGRNREPEIREIALGVPSCVYGATPIRIVLPPFVSGPAWINQLLSGQPTVPKIDPDDKSKSQQ